MRDCLFEDSQGIVREGGRNSLYWREHSNWQTDNHSGASSCDSSDRHEISGLIEGEFGLQQPVDIFNGIKKRRLFSLDEADLNEDFHSSEVSITFLHTFYFSS